MDIAKKMPKKVRFADTYFTRKGSAYSKYGNRVYVTYSFDEYADRVPDYQKHPAPSKWFDIDDETTLINTWVNRVVRR